MVVELCRKFLLVYDPLPKGRKGEVVAYKSLKALLEFGWLCNLLLINKIKIMRR